jgi:HK97 family phage major capsid protein/HK97 family phage prohead protease
MPDLHDDNAAGEARAVDMALITPAEKKAGPPPRDSLVRAMAESPTLLFRARAAAPSPVDGEDPGDASEPDEPAMPTMVGHFARFNDWTEIDSFWEGNFMEQLAPGSFKKTIAENGKNIRVLFNHGQDPSIGDKVLGAHDVLTEDREGAYYEVPLFDTSYNRDLEPGLRAGVYGASFRFKVMKEEFVQAPKPSSYNPKGLPERTIKEVALAEFGPVTFPAYESATAGVRSSALRSLTDTFILEGMAARDPEKLNGFLHVRSLVVPPAEDEVEEQPVDHEADAALDEGRAEGTHSDPDESRDDVEPVEDETTITPDAPADPPEPEEEAAEADAEEPEVEEADADEAEAVAEPESEESSTMPEPVGRNIDERRSRADEISARFQEIHTQYGATPLPDDIRSEWDALILEREENRNAIADYERRAAQLQAMAGDGKDRQVLVGTNDLRTRTDRKGVPENIYAVEDYRQFASTMDELKRGYRDGAMRAIERASFPHPKMSPDVARAHIARLLDQRDDQEGRFAQRVLVTGSPVYERAFGKTLKGSPLSAEEQRALSLGSDPDGGFAVPFQLDPTVILASDGAINPLREISRVEQIVGKEWQGITTEGITASYGDEAEEATDDSPTLVQPVVQTLRAQAFVPFSVEIGQDWGALQGEMATLLSDAKDVLEADKFVNGTGPVTQPGGVVATLDNASKVETIGATAFAVGDLYGLEEALPPRFRTKARFLANRATYNRVRQFDTGGGAALWVRLLDGLGNELIGYPAHEASEMDAGTLVGGDLIMLLGDFSKFLIVDRLGMSIELIPHLFGVAGRPTGQRGIYAIWRNSSVILVDNAFRCLKVKA